MAVGADVLDGGGASEAGDFTESFDASEAFIHGVFYDVVPIFAAHDFEAGGALLENSTHAINNNNTVEAFIMTDGVGTVAEDENR